MLFSLYETLQQIDPHVKLDDGIVVRTVEQILFSVDPQDPREYLLGVDTSGRILIFQIDAHGFAIFPAVFVEKKSPRDPPPAQQYSQVFPPFPLIC